MSLPASPKPSSRALLPVRRLSVRYILIALCVLVSLLLLITLQGAYTGRLPSVVASWTGPPPSVVEQWRSPFGSLHFGSAGGRGGKITDAQKVLTTVPEDLSVISTSANRKVNNDNNNYKYYTEAKLRGLTACLARGDCPPNADKIVIFAAYHCHMSQFMGYMGGEGVWCNSMIDSLERQGYTVLLAKDDWPYVAHIYRQMPDMVKVIIGNGKKTPDTDEKPRSGWPEEHFKSSKLPDGIPAWKVFQFYYFPNPFGTVISNFWGVSAEGEWRKPDSPHYRNNTYLGYALEPASETRTVPWSKRPNRAYILSKRVQYFYKWRAEPLIPAEFITRAYHDMRKEIPDFEFVGGFIDDRTEEEKKKLGEWKIPEGVRQLGKMNATQFDDEVANSKAMVGVGWPALSPSPYRALARGVPFLNPHKLNRPHSKEDDPSTWVETQHEGLLFEKPPHVYQTEANNYTSFITALREAMRTPIEPYILPRMTQEALDARMDAFVNFDWCSEAARILANRKAGKESEKGKNIGMFEL